MAIRLQLENTMLSEPAQLSRDRKVVAQHKPAYYSAKGLTGKGPRRLVQTYTNVCPMAHKYGSVWDTHTSTGISLSIFGQKYWTS